jgi:RNA polymerase sigma-70 factor (ECF subfamily)
MPHYAFRPSDDPATDSVAARSAEEERAFVERIRAGDHRAFEQLFATHYEALCGFVQSCLRSRESVEDLVQEIFVRIWEQRERWQPGGTIRQYLFTAARHQAISHLRHAAVLRRFEERAARDPVIPASIHPVREPDEPLHAAELTAAFEEAVRALPERRRQVLLLRWQHQMSHAEIAQILGISVKGVETQIGRAFKLIRERLARFRE